MLLAQVFLLSQTKLIGSATIHFFCNANL